jgi:hypothetical protein
MGAWHHDRLIVGRNITLTLTLTLWVSSKVWSQLAQLGSCSWKVPAGEDRSRWTGKARTLRRWKPLPSRAVKTADAYVTCASVACERGRDNVFTELCFATAFSRHTATRTRAHTHIYEYNVEIWEMYRNLKKDSYIYNACKIGMREGPAWQNLIYIKLDIGEFS